MPMVKVYTWEERIQRAQERGEFTRQDRADAGEWSHCAAGEQFALHNGGLGEAQSPAQKVMNQERFIAAGNMHENGVPVATAIMTVLGVIFPEAVKENAFETATTIQELMDQYGRQAANEFYERNGIDPATVKVIGDAFYVRENDDDEMDEDDIIASEMEDEDEDEDDRCIHCGDVH